MQGENSGISGEEKVERNHGDQPLVRIMAENRLKAHDLVAASSEQLTHKMVSRGCKGRRLTVNSKTKILRALNSRTGKNYTVEDLFNY